MNEIRICYADESGDTKPLPTATSEIAPVCVIASVAIDQAALATVTEEFLNLKAALFPRLIRQHGHWQDRVLAEIKGSDLRRAMRTGAPRRNRRQAIGFLDKFVKLLEDYDVRIFGRVWIKEIGPPIGGRALYASSMQAICADFQNLLEAKDECGLVIADSRTPALNAAVAHSVFTEKFRASGDKHDRIVEMPTFGHSQNHVGIQIADLLVSALIFPMATYAFCRGHVNSVHVDRGFGRLTDRYGQRLLRLQHRYMDSGRRRGGITVDDRLGHRSGGRLFKG